MKLTVQEVFPAVSYRREYIKRPRIFVRDRYRQRLLHQAGKLPVFLFMIVFPGFGASCLLQQGVVL